MQSVQSIQSVHSIHSVQSPMIARKKRLRKMGLVSNKVKLEKRDENSIECPICLSDLRNAEKKSIGKLACGHIFCFHCIKESSNFATKCPYCRAPYNQIFRGNKIINVQEVVPSE